MKTMYYTTSNNGDGSSSTHFFLEDGCVALLEEHDPDTYGMGEGGGSFQYTGEVDFGPYDWNKPKTLDDVKAELGL